MTTADRTLLVRRRFFLLPMILGFLSLFSLVVADERPLGIRSMTSGCEMEYPPFCLVNSAGQADGFSVDLLKASLKAMQYAVTFEVDTWSVIKLKLENAELDVLPLVGRTPERENIYDFTFPYLSLHGCIVVREGTVDITNEQELEGRKVAVMLGDNAQEFLERLQSNIEIQTTATFEDALRQLSAGKSDAVVIQRLLALRLIESLEITNLRIIDAPLEKLRQDFCFAVPEGHSEDLSILNEGLALVMADGTYSALQQQWFARTELPLTRTVIIATETGYPPYSFIDENQHAAGFNVDLTAALAKVMGLNVKIKIAPWGEIRQELESGVIDAISGMYYSAERDKLVDFSQPFTNIRHSIFSRRHSKTLYNVQDLKGKDIIVMRGDIMHDYVLERGLATDPTLVDSPAEAIQLLASGKHDCALIARIPGLYWIDEFGIDNLNISKPLALGSEYCYAVLPGDEALRHTLSEGLATLKETGEYQKIYNKWLGVLEPSPFPLRTFLKYLAFIVIPILVLLIAIIVWSQTLKVQVSRRTRELVESQQKVEASEYKFRLLADHTYDWEYWIDPQGEYVYISPACERITGYTPAEYHDHPELAFEIVRSDYREQIKDHYTNENHREDPFFSTEFPIITKSGREGWLQHHCSPVYDENGVFAGRRGSNRDVTKRKLAEIQLLQSQKLEALGTLVGGISHELNNTLQGMFLFGGLVADALPEDPELKDNFGRILGGAEKARDIVKHILTFSRGGDAELQHHCIKGLIQESVSVERFGLPKNIVIEEQLELDCGEVLCDKTQIMQIMLNLFQNAKYAMRESGGTLSIKLSKIHENLGESDKKVGVARIVVSDTGTGMSKDIISRIFDPFFTTKNIGEGTGLGLSVVHGIVEQIGGQISVTSKIDGGSRFQILLPLTEQPQSTHSEQVLVNSPEGFSENYGSMREGI